MTKSFIINITNEAGLINFSKEIDIPSELNIEQIYFDDANTFASILEEIDNLDLEYIVLVLNVNCNQIVTHFSKLLNNNYQVFILDTDNKNNIGYLEDNHNIIVINNLRELENYFKSHKCNTETTLSKKETSFIDNKEYFDTMLNGYVAYKTGSYPIDFDHTLAKHIGLEKITPNQISPVISLVDINSALFVKNDYQQKFTFSDKEQFIPHLHQVTDENIYFDDSNYKQAVKDLSFSDYVNNIDLYENDEETLYFLKISSPDDLSCFAKEINDFNTKGIFNFLNYHLIDECRFNSTCILKELYRYQINDKQQIIPCLTSDYVLCDVRDEYYEKMVLAGKAVDSVLNERNCSSCYMNESCTKCKALPKEISPQLYCQFIKDNNNLSEFLLRKQMIKYLTDNSQFFKKNIRKIELSNFYHHLAFNPITKLIDLNYLYISNTILFRINEKYYIFSLNSSNVIESDVRLIFILEGLIYTYNNKNNYNRENSINFIINEFAKQYALQQKEARRVVESGISLLKEQKVIE